MPRLGQFVLLVTTMLSSPPKLGTIPQCILPHVVALRIEGQMLLGKTASGALEQQQKDERLIRQEPPWKDEVEKMEKSEAERRQKEEVERRQGLEKALKNPDLIVMINGQIGETPTFGSGIIFGRGKDRLYIVTANHVVRSGSAEAGNLQIKLKPLPAKDLKAKLLPQSDRELDLAVLTVEGLSAQGVDVCKLSPDWLEDPATVKRGQEVYPVGNPNGVAWGMPVKPDAISDVAGDSIVFQSTLIAHGHSGGGLLGASGRLIGMIQADEPPYGRALAMGKILEVLRAWDLPIDLYVRLPSGITPLLSAVNDGNLDEARILLREVCTDVNAETYGKDMFGFPTANGTPLQVAAIQGRLEMVKLLVEAGAEVNTPGIDGSTPLELAARSGNAELLQFLIARGARINVNDPCCKSALHNAAGRGGLAAVKVLLANGADPNVVDRGNRTPLFSAIEGRQEKPVDQVEILRALKEAGAKVNWADHYGDTPLTVAVGHENLEAVRILIEAGANVDVRNRNKQSLIRLVSPGYAPGTPAMREIAALLVRSSSKIEPNDAQRLLEDSSKRGWVEVVDLLVKHGVDVKSESGNAALEEAVTNGNVEVLGVLLEAGANPDGPSRPGEATPLVSVLGGGEVDRNHINNMDPTKRLEIVKMLVSKGAKVNVYPDVPDLNFSEPLFLALITLTPPDLKVAEVLIAHGANVNAADRYGTTLLDAAAKAHDPEVVELLRRAGAKRGPFSH